MKLFDRIISLISPMVCGWIIGAGSGFILAGATWESFYGSLASLAVIVSIPIGVELYMRKQERKRRE